MNAINSFNLTPLVVLCAVPVFVILFVIILRTLRQMPLFDENNPVVLAVCVTLLCIIGLHHVFVQPAGTEAATADDAHRSLDFLLLPYTAMAMAMLLALCLLLLDKMVRSQASARLRTEMARRREHLAALRDSSKRTPQDSISPRPSRPHDEDRSGPVKHSNRLKELGTDLQKMEIRKWK
jgi:phosphotransferase system  glucose/maltose/N-acetylglucosamine-specific IIC component